MHMYTIKKSGIHGKGLFAVKRIAGGTLIGQLKGEITTKDGPHVLWITDNVGVHVKNDLRFINHSSKPNAAYYDDATVVALRDIEPGEEIVHDYTGIGAEWGE